MITMKPVIRRMTLNDIDQVYGIERRSHSTPWSKITLQREVVGNQNSLCLVAELGEKIAGFICLYMVLDEGHITNIAVDAPYQNRGIGSRLILTSIDAVKERGITHLTLEVRKSNTKAQHLYIKFGFRMSGLRKSYYTDNSEDALIFTTGDIASDSYTRLYEEIKQKLDGR